MDVESEASGHRRPGGRTARTREAALTAVLDELVEHGYRELSMDGVAARSGIHKTTLYRRWRTTEALLSEAAGSAMDAAVPIPDTGGLDTDLGALAAAIAANLERPLTRAVVQLVAAEGARLPWLREASAGFWRHRAELTGALVDRAVVRGELPAGTDPAALLEALIAPLYLRLLVTDRPLDQAAVEAAASVTSAAGRLGLLVGTTATRR